MPIKKLDEDYKKNNYENHFSVINEVNFRKLKKIQELKEQLKIKNQKEKIDKLITNEFKPINHAIDFKIKDNKKKLNIQINNRFKLDFQIVNPKKFSDKYNFENLMIPKKGIDYNQLVQEKLKNYKLKKEVVNKINFITKTEKNKKNQILLNKFKKTIIKCAIHFKRLQISLSQFYELNNKNIKPFEHNETKILLSAIKDNNFSSVYDLISNNNLLIYDFDFFHQTVLHWMAKRNRFNMIKFAIKKGAIINAIDSVGRTPLHLACFFQNIESIMILLYELANPFIKDNQGKMAIDLAQEYKIKFMLKRVSTLYLVNGVLSVKRFVENLRNGLNFLFNNELNLKFNYDKY
jgi:ankyrin repeat protein